MNETDRQYERVARWLDGERVELSPAERALADRIRADSEAVGAGLDVAARREAVERARRRMIAATARRRLPWARRAAWAAGVVAAAAVLLVAVLLRPTGPETNTPPKQPVAAALPDALVADVLADTDADLEVFAAQVDAFETDVVLAGSSATVDVEIESLERQIDEFLHDGDEASMLEG